MQPGYPGQDPYQNEPNPNQNPSDPFGQPGYGQPSYQQDPYPAQPPPYTDPYAQPQPQPPQYPQYGQPEYTQYGQPPASAPSSGQPSSGQPYGQPPYSAQPYSGQPYSGQPYPTMPQQGYQVPYGAPGYIPAGPGGPRPSNTLGLLSMIFGIISIPFGFCCGFVGIGAGGASIVLGILGLRKANQGLATNRGQALAGIICGALGVIGWIVWLAIYAKSGVFNFHSTSDY